MGLREAVAALLGISAYAGPPATQPSLGDEIVDKAREAFGGQLAPPPQSQTRWYIKDVETAEHAANAGVMEVVARLMRSARSDGVLAGVLSTRSEGLVRLPKRFRGHPAAVEALELGHESTRSDFDEMFPATELSAFVVDYILCGVAIGELVPVVGRSFPVFVRLDPEFLVYRWHENRWYYRSIIGELPITPGDGRWVLATAGRQSPWQNGLWKAVGRAYIRKEHAALHKDDWESKLAHPARVAVAPQGASETQKEGWFRRVMAWGRNTVFGLTPGYDVKLLESNGRGYESFLKTIAEQNDEMKIAVTGQTVTTDGGAGFQNSDIHKSIRADLIKATADALAYFINTQGLPAYIAAKFGPKALDTHRVIVEWDVTPPADRTREASALAQFATALQTLTAALAPYGKAPDVEALATQYGVKLKDLEAAKPANGAPPGAPRLELLQEAA